MSYSKRVGSKDDKRFYSIGELADAAGVSRRTVRYYVQRGLIDPPEGLGRSSVYSGTHAEQIQRVLRLQREGMDLDSIQQAPAEALESVKILPGGNPMLVMRIPIAPGIRLELDAGGQPPDPKTLDRLAEACARILRSGK